MTIRYPVEDGEARAAEGAYVRLEPGRYLVEIEEAVEERTQYDDSMVKLTLRAVERDTTLCWDRLVFSPKGLGIAHKKLRALGFPIPESGDVAVEAHALVGRRAYVTVEARNYTGKDGKAKQGLEVDIAATDACGYEPATPPAPLARGRAATPAPKPPARGPAGHGGTPEDPPF